MEDVVFMSYSFFPVSAVADLCTEETSLYYVVLYEIYMWLEPPTANIKVAKLLGFDPSILRRSEIWGAVLNKVHLKSKYINFSVHIIRLLSDV